MLICFAPKIVNPCKIGSLKIVISCKNKGMLTAKYPDWIDEPRLLWDRDLKSEGGITYLPLYMASLL